MGAYWWGEYKIFRRNRHVTLTQSSYKKPDYMGKFRKMANKQKQRA